MVRFGLAWLYRTACFCLADLVCSSGHLFVNHVAGGGGRGVPDKDDFDSVLMFLSFPLLGVNTYLVSAGSF